jgi:ArsR family transcriptional regulator
MNQELLELQAHTCKCLSHPKRLEILCALEAGEKSFAELQHVTGLSKANLSQHLGILRGRGMVVARRDGQHMWFAVANPKISEACGLMREVLYERIAAQQSLRGPGG